MCEVGDGRAHGQGDGVVVGQSLGHNGGRVVRPSVEITAAAEVAHPWGVGGGKTKDRDRRGLEMCGAGEGLSSKSIKQELEYRAIVCV